jgi:hypothetical protein
MSTSIANIADNCVPFHLNTHPNHSETTRWHPQLLAGACSQRLPVIDSNYH